MVNVEKRGRGRPAGSGKIVTNILVGLDSEMRDNLDSFVRAKHMSKSDIIREALRLYTAAEQAKAEALDEEFYKKYGYYPWEDEYPDVSVDDEIDDFDE